MSESLRNDGRVWVPKTAGDPRSPAEIPEADRDYFLERRYPSFGNLVPRDVASRAAKERCDAGFGVGGPRRAVYRDFRDASRRDGSGTLLQMHGDLLRRYATTTGQDPYGTPLLTQPAMV